MLRVFSASSLLALALGCATASPPPSMSGDEASMCPAPTEGCMNEENHAQCLEAEAKCPGKVVTLESCPLQFGCE